MRKLLFALIIFTISAPLLAQSNSKNKIAKTDILVENAPLSIVPKPMSATVTSGSFSITNKTIIYVSDEESKNVAKSLVNRLKIDGTVVSIVDLNNAKADKNVIFFIKTTENSLGTEGYRLSVTPTQINVRAATAQGMFYAVQSLLQVLPSEVFSTATVRKKVGWKVSCVEIEDNPRYSYRGLHLDVARHFQPVSFIKEYIDLLALHKMNTFHWHLTDDQGWRIEIKKYPKLTEIGSKRKQTLVGSFADVPEKFDGTPYGGFYTQEQIKEVVAYAKERFINIIPEIEMPGHALAALSAYPELSCEPARTYEAATKWGVFEDVFCPSEYTFGFLQDVLSEVIDLFPSKYIHIGGDECPKTAWKKSSFCQDLIKKENLKDEHGLQSYFIQRIEKFVNTKGRSIIGWDEILEGGLAPNATVMSWRGTEGGILAAKQNHDVVMTPGSHCYFDQYQADPENEPLAIGGFTTLEKVYAYEPTPDVLTPEQKKHILGAQGNVWTEYMKTSDKIEYMAYPRACALAEILWTPKGKQNFTDFANRLDLHLSRLDKLKINYAKHLNNVKIELTNSENTPSVNLTSTTKKNEIRYTMDGTEPNAASPIFSKSIAIKDVTKVKAATFQGGKMMSQVTKESFFPHSAFNFTYSFANKPNNTYESGENGLTNGIKGTTKSYAQWVGFNGTDMEVTFDFKERRSFNNVFVQFLNKPESWVFLPDYVMVSVSNDGKEWLDINRSDFAHGRTDRSYIREAKMQFSEFTKPKRYLKVFAKNIGKCPEGHEGAGQAAWLFADEIIID